MTMTTVAVAPGSLGAPPAMLTPNRYHLQQGMASNSSSPSPGKNYDTLGKSKKSWSVRLGLSRQHQTSEDPGKGWGTISGGSVLSRQMVYGDPWLYGTVRSQRVTRDPRAFLTPPPAGAPVLIVCSCPEFLSGTTRKLGNCRKCGGHRLAGIPMGGTCRVAPTSGSRSRPSLAGVLRSSVDDPYDLMRRSRLVEPRSRARSISPHRQPSQKDTRSQSVVRSGKDRKGTSDGVASRSEWFDTEVGYEKETSRRARPSFAGAPSGDDWLEEVPLEEPRIAAGKVIRSTKRKNDVSADWLEASPSPRIANGPRKSAQSDWNVDTSSSSSTSTIGNDSRKSILECDINPYLLVKKQLRDEDDLSDDLSDNALELEEAPSTLFDSSKVKSIERIPNRSAVAAIGGQRIRVFNETRKISEGEEEEEEEEEEELPVTKIPIPKVIPKRPPRRQKEARVTAIRSILKKGKTEGKRRNVLFNVDNVIFAPEKMEVSSSRRTSKSSIGSSKESDMEESVVPEEQAQEKPKFITIPNIKDVRGRDRSRTNDARIMPRTKKDPPSVDRIKIDKFVPSQKCTVIDSTLRRNEVSIGTFNATYASLKTEEIGDDDESKANWKRKQNENEVVTSIKPEDETELEIEIEELRDRFPEIAVDEKDLILKSEDEVQTIRNPCEDDSTGLQANSRRSSLKRSQSERTVAKPELTAGSVLFADTMRLSFCKRGKDSTASSHTLTIAEKIEAAEEKKIERIDEEVEEEEEEEEEEVTLKDGQVGEAPEKVSELLEKEAEPPPNLDVGNNTVLPNLVHFRKMRPTSWSPPPGKHKRFPGNRISDPGSMDRNCRSIGMTSNVEGHPVNPRSSFGTTGSSKIEIGSENVCKITVSPVTSPLVHRLQIGSEGPGSGRRTSIMINAEQDSSSIEPGSSSNKVTISVGGEDSICSPTVISVNSDSSPKIQSFSENRTLVILDNYRSNIVIESPKEKSSLEGRRGIETDEGSVSSTEEKLKRVIDERSSRKIDEEDQVLTAKVVDRWTTLSKEAVISRLLEDSLKKARENGEILDESSGEAILKILKQTLLKSREYESSESTIEPESNYSRSSSINSESDFVSTNLFLEENPYEVIKEPIYEEIPDEPPPLPSSPPPTEDYLKDRIYFGNEYNKVYKEAYYKKVNAGQFLRSYLPEDFFKKPTSEDLTPEEYLSKSHEDFFKKSSLTGENFSTKFELLNFLMDSKDRTNPVGEEDEDEEEEEEEDEVEEDAEGELEALYEQKETSLGDLSSKSSQISNVSDSSEECNILLTSSPETLKTRTIDIERTDSGVGSESSQASSTRGIARRWRTGNASSGPGSLLGGVPPVASGDTKLCEDCEQRLEPLITDSGVVYAPFVCRKCSKKRAERKEIITEIVETEQKYGRDLHIILEEFHRPMLRAGLLTQEQLSAIFLNVEELLEHNALLAEKLKDALELAQESGDEDLVTVDVGKIFLESERMLHAFENYCTRQGSASLLLQNLEKEKELLRIFLKVSQMENTVLRRMNLNSFLMVPVQRVTKYPLLLARLLKATPSICPDVQEAKKRLKQAQTNIELHLEHMNAEAKDVTSTKLWRRISIIQNGRRTTGEQDMVNIKLRKMAVQVLEWAHEEARFVLEGRLLVAQPTDNNWRRGRTVKLAPVIAMLVTNGKSNTEFLDFTDDSLFPRQIQIKEATLLLVKEKIGRYSLLREPLYLDKCIVCCETDLEDYFEIQELSSKETFIFKKNNSIVGRLRTAPELKDGAERYRLMHNHSALGAGVAAHCQIL